MYHECLGIPPVDLEEESQERVAWVSQLRPLPGCTRLYLDKPGHGTWYKTSRETEWPEVDPWKVISWQDRAVINDSPPLSVCLAVTATLCASKQWWWPGTTRVAAGWHRMAAWAEWVCVGCCPQSCWDATLSSSTGSDWKTARFLKDFVPPCFKFQFVLKVQQLIWWWMRPKDSLKIHRRKPKKRRSNWELENVVVVKHWHCHSNTVRWHFVTGQYVRTGSHVLF